MVKGSPKLFGRKQKIGNLIIWRVRDFRDVYHLMDGILVIWKLFFKKSYSTNRVMNAIEETFSRVHVLCKFKRVQIISNCDRVCKLVTYTNLPIKKKKKTHTSSWNWWVQIQNFCRLHLHMEGSIDIIMESPVSLETSLQKWILPWREVWERY